MMSVTYSADIWDGHEAHDSLGVATAANETEAIKKRRHGLSRSHRFQKARRG